jgi:hypothetical protein
VQSISLIIATLDRAKLLSRADRHRQAQQCLPAGLARRRAAPHCRSPRPPARRTAALELARAGDRAHRRRVKSPRCCPRRPSCRLHASLRPWPDAYANPRVRACSTGVLKSCLRPCAPPSRLGEHRCVPHRLIQRQPDKPAEQQIVVELLHQPQLRTHRVEGLQSRARSSLSGGIEGRPNLA